MAKSRASWNCTACDYSSPKWLGRCPHCKAWGTLEEVAGATRPRAAAGAAEPIALHEVRLDQGGAVRVRTGLDELDRPLGGGLVAGSLVLLGGDPGVGKSTLILMALDRFSQKGLPVLYVTGEESLRQVRLRADRLGVGGEGLLLLADTDFENIERVVRKHTSRIVVIDSVQTVSVPELSNIPGSVAQVREVAHRSMVLSKGTGTTVVLIGHVTKSGEIAGPKILEHLVDTVLHFEGDGRSSLRILRSVKNRFGAAGELGMFEMADDGLREVPDASARLLQERIEGAPGTAVIAAVEGTRPLLTEVQALVGTSGSPVPARTCAGVDRTRVLLLAAVLQKHGLALQDRDLFVNAAGGMRLVEPAVDLGIVAAIASSYQEAPLPSGTLVFGEVGLVGEIRATSHPVPRLREAARHGFRRVIAPVRSVADAPPGVEVVGVRSVGEALEALF